MKVDTRKKREVLRDLLRAEGVTNAIIFCNRKTTVRELNKSLQRHGFASGEIHGDIDQSARLAELDRFKTGDVTILVASDVAARGLDIKGVSHVFNFDAPWHPDDYVHRIGRTGRAGAKGVAYTFVTKEDAEAIDNIQKLIGTSIDYAARAAGESDAEVSEEPAKMRSKARRGEKSREERPREPRAREDRPREDRPREDRAHDGRSQARQPRFQDVDGTPEDGAWNGPVPDFLGVGFSQ